jgi:hypothetical protein
MTKVALTLAAFALATGLYGSFSVVPRYKEANDAWMQVSMRRYAYGSRQEVASREVEGERQRLRNRSQQYAFGIIGAGSVGLLLAFIAMRRKPRGQAIAAAAMAGASLALFGYMQAFGNIF